MRETPINGIVADTLPVTQKNKLQYFPLYGAIKCNILFPQSMKWPFFTRVCLVVVTLFWLGARPGCGADEGAKKDHGLLASKDAALPSLPVSHEGFATAMLGNRVVVLGGWDEATRQPRHEYWSAVPADAGWTRGELPSPLAFAAVAQDEGSFICAGGIGPEGVVARVSRYRWDKGQLVGENLPDLPVPVAGAGAAVLKNVLYVVGGVSGLGAEAAGNGFYTLDLTNPSAGWQALPVLPGEGRVRPAVASQYGVIQVFGGFVQAGGQWNASADVWIYRPVPLEGTMQKGWYAGEKMPLPLGAASAVPIGQAQTLLAGGGSLSTQESGPSWMMRPTAVPSPIRLYHLVTDIWVGTAVETRAASARLLDSGGGSFLLLAHSPDGKVSEITGIRSVRNLNWLDYLFIVGYFIFIAWIGFYFSGKQESSAEFSLGNRQVKWWAAGISMFATGASAISFMAIPALAFSTNLIWLFPLIAFVPAYFVQAHVIMPLLRGLEITSTYEYLERRFNKTLRTIACVQCILLQTFGRSSIVLVLPSLAISATTGIDVYLSVLIMGVVTTVYTAIGGFDAVIWTEVFQGLLKFVAPLVMIGICLYNLPGGVGEFIRVGLDHDKFVFALPTLDMTVPGVWLLVLSTLMTATLGAAGDQPIIQRIFSAPLKEVRRVTAMSTACGIIIGIIVNFMGLAIFCYFRAHPEQYDAQAQNDQIVPMFVTQALPHGVAGIVIAAIFASAMATVASAMNSVATIYTEDIHPFFRQGASDASRLRTMKITSYAVGFLGTLIALVLASMNLKSIMVVWSQIVALMGGGVVGVYSLGMFTKRANGFGAIVGVVASVLVTAGIKAFTPLHWATYLPIAILTCVGVGYLASLFFGRHKSDLSGLTVFTPARPLRME
jgi:solute:Na+ symporter, SSS family